MKRHSRYVLCMMLLLFNFILSCKKDTEENTSPSSNKFPIANAGLDQTLYLPKDSIVLDAANSNDPDGIIAKYLWTKVSGPAAGVIVSPHTSQTIVRSLAEGLYKFEVMVTDNKGASAKDTVQIIVTTSNGTNHAPVAHAGSDMIIALPTNFAFLNGSTSYDPDGTITDYLWAYISGPPTVTIQDPKAAQTVANNLSAGIYLFALMVMDNKGATAKDTVQVTVEPTGLVNCDITNRPKINITLNEIGSLSVARMPYVAAAGNKIVFAGGSGNSEFALSAVDIYDITDGKWNTTRLSIGRESLAAISCGNKVFFAGGRNGEIEYDNVDIYDVVNNTWKVAHLSQPRSHLAATVLGNKVYFAGGLTDGLFGVSNTIDIYDISDSSWSTTTLPIAKFSLSAVAAGDKIYFAGGFDWDHWNAPFKSIDVYTPSTNRWTTASLKEITGGVSGVTLNKNIYWGGVDVQQNIGKAESFNIENNAQTSIGCLSYPRRFPTAVVRNNDIAFFSTNERMFLDVYTRQVDIYNTATNQWTIGLLDQAMAGAGIISVNNTIYMGGGLQSNNRFSNKVYIVSW